MLYTYKYCTDQREKRCAVCFHFHCSGANNDSHRYQSAERNVDATNHTSAFGHKEDDERVSQSGKQPQKERAELNTEKTKRNEEDETNQPTNGGKRLECNP